MGILSKLFGRNRDDDDEPAPIVLDEERRKPQLLRLEKALDALAAEMRRNSTMDNPGWRGRVNEYSRLAGECRRCAAVRSVGKRYWISCSRSARSSPVPYQPAWNPSSRSRTRSWRLPRTSANSCQANGLEGLVEDRG